MKKKMQKLQLRKSTINNLDQAGMRRIAGGIDTKKAWCLTEIFGCNTGPISNCTACYSCIECPPPPDSMFLPCEGTIDFR
jgi:hypothetical protein